MVYSVTRTTVAAVFAGMLSILGVQSAFAWEFQQGDQRISGEQLAEVIIGRELHFIYSTALNQQGVEQYMANGTYSLDYTSDGNKREWGGTYAIKGDGQLCVRREGSERESCQLFIANGGKLVKLDKMGGRYTAEIR